MMTNMQKVMVFTDGSCNRNTGLGGWGAILRYCEIEKELSGYEKKTTNNRMEIMAAIQALRVLRCPCQVEIFTDSEYLARGFDWTTGWISNGWKTADGKPVKNKDLWLDLLDAAKPHNVNFTWVKGHNGHVENERADRLAKQARDSAIGC
jgi:ribonuclease HI